MQMAWFRALAVTLALASVGGACSTALRNSVDGSPPTTNRLPGKFVWFDLVTDKADKARRFYEGLLGWKFERTSRFDEPYWLASNNGRYVGGLVPIESRRDLARPVSQWLGYISVPSVEQAVRRVEARGGSVARGPAQVGDVGRAAIIRDFEGAPVGLASIVGGDPPDMPEPVAGAFFWMEYVAEDLPAAAAFYQDVAGYSIDRRKSGSSDYYVLNAGGERAGMYAAPAPELKSVWLPYVRVSDPAALAARARELGGKVLLDPASGVRGGTFAIVADPSGAVIALQKYPL
jgi:uncharacterized protein